MIIKLLKRLFYNIDISSILKNLDITELHELSFIEGNKRFLIYKNENLKLINIEVYELDKYELYDYLLTSVIVPYKIREGGTNERTVIDVG